MALREFESTYAADVAQATAEDDFAWVPAWLLEAFVRSLEGPLEAMLGLLKDAGKRFSGEGLFSPWMHALVLGLALLPTWFLARPLLRILARKMGSFLSAILGSEKPTPSGSPIQQRNNLGEEGLEAPRQKRQPGEDQWIAEARAHLARGDTVEAVKSLPRNWERAHRERSFTFRELLSARAGSGDPRVERLAGFYARVMHAGEVPQVPACERFLEDLLSVQKGSGQGSTDLGGSRNGT